MVSKPQTRVEFVAGLDLGQAQQVTALAVVEKTSTGEHGRPETWAWSYAVRHLERFPLGTPYPEIIGRLKALFADSPLRRTPLVVDRTGVGKAVVDLLEKAAVTRPVWHVTVTAGIDVVGDGHGHYQVPKTDLVAALQVLLQTRRLRVAESLTEANTLVTELTTFQARPHPPNTDPLTAWREGAHDDLVLAVGVATWWAERMLLPGFAGRPFAIESIGLRW